MTPSGLRKVSLVSDFAEFDISQSYVQRLKKKKADFRTQIYLDPILITLSEMPPYLLSVRTVSL